MRMCHRLILGPISCFVVASDLASSFMHPKKVAIVCFCCAPTGRHAQLLFVGLSWTDSRSLALYMNKTDLHDVDFPELQHVMLKEAPFRHIFLDKDEHHLVCLSASGSWLVILELGAWLAGIQKSYHSVSFDTTVSLLLMPHPSLSRFFLYMSDTLHLFDIQEKESLSLSVALAVDDTLSAACWSMDGSMLLVGTAQGRLLSLPFDGKSRSIVSEPVQSQACPNPKPIRQILCLASQAYVLVLDEPDVDARNLFLLELDRAHVSNLTV